MGEKRSGYVSRAALKLLAALDHFGLDVADAVCADLGCNVGGFTQVLLERGARRVYAVDTGYGALDYKLRTDPRVVVMERTNALHVTLPEPCRLVTIDVAWTRQQHILPAAARLLDPQGMICSLLKPHYEAPPEWLRRGVLDPDKRAPVVEQTLAAIRKLGFTVRGQMEAVVAGQAGNVEHMLLVVPSAGTTL